MKLRTRGRFSVKRWGRFLADRLHGNPFERALRAARGEPPHTFVFGWNRGLGDIALGLAPLFARIRAQCPGSRIVVFTRPELRDPFQMADIDALHIVDGLKRGDAVDVAAAAKVAKLPLEAITTVFADPDPTRWLDGRRREYPPTLRWNDDWNALAADLGAAPPNAIVIGAHVNSETTQFYGYVKDWPADHWDALFKCFATPDVHWLLFGNAGTTPRPGPNATDLRGRTTYLQLMALIRTRCRVLVAPDSGVLTTAYYLDQDFPLEVVSLWSDPRQGIRKQGCASPNPRLRHVALLGPDENLGRLAVATVAAAIENALRHARAQVKDFDAVAR